jgi:hypothetical protein
LEESDASKEGNGFIEEQHEVPGITDSCDNKDDSRVLSGIELASKNGKLVFNTLPPQIRKRASKTFFE